jgi:hypothetical protein
MIAFAHDDDDTLLINFASDNQFAALTVKDNDEAEGGVKLPKDDDKIDDKDADAPKPLANLLREAYDTTELRSIITECQQHLQNNTVPPLLKTHWIAPSDCAFTQGMLLVNSRLFIPDHHNLRTRYVREHHNTPLAGHQGTNRTFELLTRTVFWPKM